jgi:hypothetical protein
MSAEIKGNIASKTLKNDHLISLAAISLTRPIKPAQ